MPPGNSGMTVSSFPKGWIGPSTPRYHLAAPRVSLGASSLGCCSIWVGKQSWAPWDAWLLPTQRKKGKFWASLGVRLPTQETLVSFLVQKDPTCRGATQPGAPQLVSLCSRTREPQLLSSRAATPDARALGSVLCTERRHRDEKPELRNREKPAGSSEDPAQPK